MGNSIWSSKHFGVWRRSLSGFLNKRMIAGKILQWKDCWFWINSGSYSLCPIACYSSWPSLSFFGQNKINNIDAKHWLRIRLNVFLFNSISCFLFSSHISFPLFLFDFLSFPFYALSCPFVFMVLFLFSLFIIFTKNNLLHPFHGHGVLSVPAQ